MKPKDSYELKFQLLSLKHILSASLSRKKGQPFTLFGSIWKPNTEISTSHEALPPPPIFRWRNTWRHLLCLWITGSVCSLILEGGTMAQLESLLAKSNLAWLDSHVPLETKVNNGLGQGLMVPVSISFYLSFLVLPWKNPPTDNTYTHARTQAHTHTQCDKYCWLWTWDLRRMGRWKDNDSPFEWVGLAGPCELEGRQAGTEHSD